jgi:hypothetical protein
MEVATFSFHAAFHFSRRIKAEERLASISSPRHGASAASADGEHVIEKRSRNAEKRTELLTVRKLSLHEKRREEGRRLSGRLTPASHSAVLVRQVQKNGDRPYHGCGARGYDLPEWSRI